MAIYQSLSSLVEIVGITSYLGIFFLMFLESTFFPFPSEIVMIPAGYLASLGKINLFLAIILGIIGSVSGACFNYLLAAKFGRKFILRFMSEKKLRALERFFERHGPISTFNGRLIPVVRQYISLPAGLAKMPRLKFVLYTSLGGSIWVTLLTLLGYFLGQNRFLLHRYSRSATVIMIIIVGLITFVYVYLNRKIRRDPK